MVLVHTGRKTRGGYFRPAPSQQSGDGAQPRAHPWATAPSIDKIGSIRPVARTLPRASLGQAYRWLNFTSWIMSSGECSTKCQEHSLPTTWMNLFLKAARPTPESMGMGPRIGNVLSW